MEYLTSKSWATLARQALKNLWNSWHRRWHSLHAPKQIGIYWSGKLGAGQGQLYLDDDATKNPHYNVDAATKIGKAAMSTENGYYEIAVSSVATDCKGARTSHTLDCSAPGKCIMDSGTPSIVVPKAVYDDLLKGQRGTLTVNLVGHDFGLGIDQVTGLPLPQSIELKFDVETLFNQYWIEASQEDDFILGLPLRAFYYTVMDISDSTASFSPMAAYHH